MNAHGRGSHAAPSRPTLERRLQRLRRDLDRIDDQLVAALDRRARLAVQIGEVKRQLRLRLRAPEREQAVLGRILARSDGPLTPAGVRRIYGEIMRACLAIQRVRRAPERECPPST